MISTKEWAASHGVCVADDVPAVEGYDKPYKRGGEDIAFRALILHCVAAVGYGVEPGLIIEWLKDEDLWGQVSANEQAFLTAEGRSDRECSDARWRQEAEWTLLWTIQKVDSLGLPIQTCDTARLVDDIMPPLGGSIGPYVSSAHLRPTAELLAEDDRIYNLHCYARQAYRANALPDDLLYDVLFQRHYAIEWLNGAADWDDVSVDT